MNTSAHSVCTRFLTLTHSSGSDIDPNTQYYGNQGDNIYLFHTFPIFPCSRYNECYLCALTSFVLSYEHTDPHTQSQWKEHSLWVLHLVSVFSTDCGGSRFSFWVVLMWRDDTCESWIEHHKGFQIESLEWWWWVGSLFLVFTL